MVLCISLSTGIDRIMFARYWSRVRNKKSLVHFKPIYFSQNISNNLIRLVLFTYRCLCVFISKQIFIYAGDYVTVNNLTFCYF